MATIALPIRQLEDRMSLVDLSLRVMLARHHAKRLWDDLCALGCKLHLTVNLHEIVTLQDKMLDELNGGAVKVLTPSELLEIAGRLDELVEFSNLKLAEAKAVDFRLWQSSLRRIAEQVERFDSLAETYRESASEEYTAYIDNLVESASDNASHKVESWSDFVASLQD